MKKRLRIAGVLTLSVLGNGHAQANNALFAKPHVQASPLTLSQGTLVLGTSFAYGVTDFFQIGTNILRDFYQFYNANAKVSFYSVETFAFALTGGFGTYNLRRISSLNPDATVTSWIPGVTTAFQIQDRVALIAGLEVGIHSLRVNSASTQNSGYQKGAQTGADLVWAYHPPTKQHDVSNALAAGVTYDFTYNLYGFGMSHHWPGFQVGFHYYPDADRNNLVPIVAGGIAVEI